ncbi:hypothetical protein Tco_0991892 [Tanacetum coccineum]|uniref:Xylulose kinase-1 n=1 Tax=Tanacetum coccineum TaxID=301880 RepID=A0ABQ5F1A6_9ASTR
MADLKFADTHNLVAFLSKPAESEGFEQIVDFLNTNPINYALTVNPTIYTSCIEQFWSTVKMKIVNGEVQLQALVDGKKVIITESNVRRDLHLEDDEAQEEMGEGSANPTAPHHTPIITQPSTSQPQKKQKPRKPNRKDTKVPQPSGPTTNVADEVDNEENVSKHSNGPLLSEITLVDETQGRYGDEYMFVVNDLDGDEVFVETEVHHEVDVESEVASKYVNLANVDMTLAQALAELKSAKPKADKAVVQEPEQGTTTTTTAATTPIPASIRPKTKGLVIHEEEQASTPTLIVSSQQSL